MIEGKKEEKRKENPQPYRSYHIISSNKNCLYPLAVTETKQTTNAHQFLQALRRENVQKKHVSPIFNYHKSILHLQQQQKTNKTPTR